VLPDEETSTPAALRARRDDRERRRLVEAADHLSALTRELSDALHAPAADPEALDDLQHRINRAAAVQARLFVEWQLAMPRIAPAARSFAATSFRERALDALEILGAPATPRQVGDVAAVALESELAPGRFASLRRDERRAYERGPDARPAWIVPALGAEDFAPMAGIVAVSAWESERRLIGARSERVYFLHHLLALLRLAARPEVAADARRAARLADLIARSARSVLDPRHRWAPGAPSEIRTAAEAELAQIEPADLAERRAAAARLARLSPTERVWGRGTDPAPAEAGVAGW
jgi:hypothetical protein